MTNVLNEILQERRRQDEKWGEQNHPDGTGPDKQTLFQIWSHAAGPGSYDPLEDFAGEDLAKAATESTDKRAGFGCVTWTDILLEEVFEALAESDRAKLRTELVQVAAVATQWVEAIDRREVSE